MREDKGQDLAWGQKELEKPKAGEMFAILIPQVSSLGTVKTEYLETVGFHNTSNNSVMLQISHMIAWKNTTLL